MYKYTKKFAHTHTHTHTHTHGTKHEERYSWEHTVQLLQYPHWVCIMMYSITN